MNTSVFFHFFSTNDMTKLHCNGVRGCTNRKVFVCMVAWGVFAASGLKIVVRLVAAGLFGASGFKVLVCLVA